MWRMMHWKFHPLLLCIFALAIIFSHAQDLSSGFISIDCGLSPENDNYRDDSTGIPYSTDVSFIDTGENQYIASDYINNSLATQLRTVRSFPQGTRNCYNLTAMQAKGTKYLIRATFMYGNYDGKSQTPTFDLHLGVERWDKVQVNDSTSAITKEIIHVPSSNYFYVCLVNLDKGTPFISALELRRPMNQSVYPTTNSNDSLATYFRLNFAPADPSKVIRYPDDSIDRLWQPFATPLMWAPLNTTLSMNVGTYYQPPVAVMQTAVTPQNASEPLQFYWTPSDFNAQFYVYMHFAEVVRLQSNQYRAFYVTLVNQRWYDQPLVPIYLTLDTIYARIGITEASFNYSLVKAENSTLPPIINALEVYLVKKFYQSQTDEADMWAILNIKSTYGVNRSDWQGDPCLPAEFKWGDLDCIFYDNMSAPPRIKSLNLSSSGLTGNVSPFLSNLTFLENLDLSNNSLKGAVPDFLADLPQLKALNLSGNQFSGLIPQELLDKMNSTLELRADGYLFGTPNPCEVDQCKRKRSKKFLVPLVVSLAASLIILAALILVLKLRMKSRRTKQNVENLGATSNRKDGFLETKNMRYTYSDILKMTNNFQRVLGQGGFGTVYHGVIDGKQVAVKLLSESSAQGYHEFHSEAEVLTRVHHRNLTSLVGYCYEDTHLALVYEYMANGNVRARLSVSDDNVLGWLQRLQIALDAAQGLDYLHNHCTPAIIHRDIKSTNILLNEHFEAKLADFGLSRVFNGSCVVTRVVGTPGYLDPEYHETERLHEKSDIYSFGILMLELITGRQVITRIGDKRHISQWVNFWLERGNIRSIMDPKLRGMYDINSAWKASELAMACASAISVKRPTMAYVLTELAECLAAERAHAGGQFTDSEHILPVKSGVLETGVASR